MLSWIVSHVQLHPYPFLLNDYHEEERCDKKIADLSRCLNLHILYIGFIIIFICLPCLVLFISISIVHNDNLLLKISFLSELLKFLPIKNFQYCYTNECIAFEDH